MFFSRVIRVIRAIKVVCEYPVAFRELGSPVNIDGVISVVLNLNKLSPETKVEYSNNFVCHYCIQDFELILRWFLGIVWTCIVPLVHERDRTRSPVWPRSH